MDKFLMTNKACPRAGSFCTYLGAIIALSACLIANSAHAESGSSDLFSETIITETVERVPSVAELSADEVGQLRAAKTALTEFFERLHQAPGASPLELLTARIRGQYADSREFYRQNFAYESIISYRIFDFKADFDHGAVTFRIFLRQTMEGTDYIEQRIVSLRRTGDDWQIDGLR